MIHHFLINIKHFFKIFTNLFKISPSFVQNDINVITFPVTFPVPLTLAPPAPRVTSGPSSALDMNADAPRALRSRTRPLDQSKRHRPPDHFFLSSPFFFFPRNESRILRGTKVIARPSLKETEFVSSLYRSVKSVIFDVTFSILFTIRSYRAKRSL